MNFGGEDVLHGATEAGKGGETPIPDLPLV